MFADGKNIAQVPNATGEVFPWRRSLSADHVLLRLADLSDDPPIFITVRSRTREGAVSSDSNVARVPRGRGVLGETMLPQSSRDLQQEPLFQTASTSFSYPLPSMPTQVFPQSFPYASTSAYPSATGLGGVPLQQSLVPQTTTLTAPHLQSSLAQSLPVSLAPSLGATLQQPLSSGVQPLHFSVPLVAPLAPLAGSQPAPSLPPLPFQSNPLDTYSSLLHGYNYNSLETSMAPPPVSLLLFFLNHVSQRKSQSLSQYYTFHPQFLYKESTAAEEKPSVLEMEQNYVLKHRQQGDWAQSALFPDARSRIESYVRGSARVGSAEDKILPGRRIAPPRLARVKSEQGFGTR